MVVKKWVWKEIAEIIGVLGIIAGMVFLGYELRQNNELLEAEARAARNEKAAVIFAAPYSHPTLATALAKLETGDGLTPTERVQVEAYANSMLRNLEGNYAEIALGRLDPNPSILAWRSLIGDSDLPWRTYWNEYKGRSSPDFVDWFEQNVFEVMGR